MAAAFSMAAAWRGWRHLAAASGLLYGMGSQSQACWKKEGMCSNGM